MNTNQSQPIGSNSDESLVENDESLVENDESLFERPQNIKRMITGLVILCIALVMAELFYTNDHAHFGIESIWGFQAWFGFLAFVGIVFLGRVLRMFVSRPEDYYDC